MLLTLHRRVVSEQRGLRLRLGRRGLQGLGWRAGRLGRRRRLHLLQALQVLEVLLLQVGELLLLQGWLGALQGLLGELVRVGRWRRDDPMDCSLSGSSVYEILQARIPECIAVPFSRGSSQLRN